MKTTELLNLTQNNKTYLSIKMVDNIMLHEWHGIIKEDNFKKAIDQIGSFSEIHKPVAYIARFVEHTGVSPTAQAYAASMTSNYVKKTFTTTYPGQNFKQIMVISNDVFLKFAAEGYARRVENNIETYFTISLEEAYQLAGLKKN